MKAGFGIWNFGFRAFCLLFSFVFASEAAAFPLIRDAEIEDTCALTHLPYSKRRG